MNKLSIIGLALVVGGGIATGLVLSIHHSSAEIPTPTRPVDQHQVLLQHPDKPISTVIPASVTEAEWQRLPKLTSDEQERYATRVMNQQGWSAEMRLGLLAQLGNRALSPLTRNNLAIGILRNGSGTTDLEQALWTAYDDVSEDPVWREYTIQFMAVCLEEGSTAAGSRTRVLDAFHGGWWTGTY